MRGLISRRGLDNSHNTLRVAAANRSRVRGRVQLAIIVGLACLAGLGLVMSSSLVAEDPEPRVPTVVGFQVTWEEDDPEFNTYKFTFSGSVANCEHIPYPMITFVGYPFDGSAIVDLNGTFSFEVTTNGQRASIEL